MKEKQEKILKEIRKVELAMFKDVEITAKRINDERRKKLGIEKNISPKYYDKRTESFTNHSGMSIKIKKYMPHEMGMECA